MVAALERDTFTYQPIKDFVPQSEQVPISIDNPIPIQRNRKPFQYDGTVARFVIPEGGREATLFEKLQMSKLLTEPIDYVVVVPWTVSFELHPHHIYQIAP